MIVETTYEPIIWMDNGNFGVFGRKMVINCEIEYPSYVTINAYWNTPHNNIAVLVWMLNCAEL